MATSVAAKMEMTITDTFSATGISTSGNTLKWSAKNINKTLSASASPGPAVTKSAVADLALSGGALTVNLAAVVTNDGRTVDFTSSKVQFLKLRNKSTNANNLVIANGASNGIDLLGATFSFTLQPGQAIMIDFNNLSPTVASGDRTFDVTGTGSQILELEAVG